MGQPRNVKFQLRLTETESAMLGRQAARIGMTKTRYITYLLEREHKAALVVGNADPSAGQPVIVYRDADFRRLLWHLGKWGNNLNQAAYALNAIASRRFLSEAKTIEMLERAAARIEASSVAIESISENVERLQEGRHIVMWD